MKSVLIWNGGMMKIQFLRQNRTDHYAQRFPWCELCADVFFFLSLDRIMDCDIRSQKHSVVFTFLYNSFAACFMTIRNDWPYFFSYQLAKLFNRTKLFYSTIVTHVELFCHKRTLIVLATKHWRSQENKNSPSWNLLIADLTPKHHS